MKFENCSCKNTKPARVTKEIPLGGTTVLVEDAPANVCQDCGTIYFDSQYLLELEKEILSDVPAARRAREEKGFITLEQLEAELELKEIES